MPSKSLHLRLPATSANLGPGFDAVGLAMQLYLHVEAQVSNAYSIAATGRDTDVVGKLENNLILETYRAVAPQGPALALTIANEIPLGMGCGSSAAALLAGVHLANHFGHLGWSPQQVLEEACVREGHPDNVAACFYGGLTVSAMHGKTVTAATLGRDVPWRLLLVLPDQGLATTKARALLPASYSRADVVANVQATSLLVAAFALGRPDLLRAGTEDRMHQPYRAEVCPLLPLLLPLQGTTGIFSVTLSGAGPSVLLIVDPAVQIDTVLRQIRSAAGLTLLEVVETKVV